MSFSVIASSAGGNWGRETESLKFLEKIKNINWIFIGLITLAACVGFAALYSAAGGDWSPWAKRQVMRFGLGLGILFFVALVDMRIWFRLSYPIYGLGLILLLAVEAMGAIGMGAQRWINLGFINLQPSELMKIAVVMALAKYFHGLAAEETKKLFFLIPPIGIILVPVGLVMLQPDLGTALMITMAGAAMCFLAGVRYWVFGLAAAVGAAAIPIGWQFLHDYQKNRILTFFNPERDPLGAGYHITQSKIALGSGGIEGKGFLNGTQSHLNFLPEKQTDFIFTLLAEEWGFIGGISLIILLGVLFYYGLFIALRSRSEYGRLLAMGMGVNFSLYVFVNIAMVMGLIPVVGAPLPLISYGGTAMLAALIGFGLMINANIHRHTKLARYV